MHDFQIESNIYCVSRRMLKRQSTFFEDLLLGSLGSIPKGHDERCPIELTGITQFEMDSLLHVLHAS